MRGDRPGRALQAPGAGVEASEVSNGDFFAPALSERRPVALPPPPEPAPRARRWWLVAGAMVALLALVAAVVHLRRPPQDHRPVVLPDQIQGLALAPDVDQFAAPDWRDSLREKLGDMPFDGRRYGTIAEQLVVNVTVMRGTSDEAGDARLGGEPYTTYGEVRCTHTMVLPAAANGGTEKVTTLTHWLLCVRTRDTLTVTVLVLMGAEEWEEQAARAVDDVWALQG